MDISKFVYIFHRSEEYFLYSALSNSLAKIDEDLYHLLVDIDQKNNVDVEVPEDIMLQLIKMKVINVDDEKEIAGIKFHILSNRFYPRTLHLTINPTLACNFNCEYCFESSHPVKHMSDNIEDDIIKFIKNKDLVNKIKVTWFGGEPLLAFKRIISLSERILGLGYDYSAGMITNGYLMTEDVIRKFKDLRIRTVQITIDGNETLHNKRRALKNGGKTYNKILDNIERAQNLSPETKIIVRVNIDPETATDFINIWNLFREKKYPNLNVYPGFITDKTGNRNRECMFDHKAIANFLMDLYYKHNVYIPMFFPPTGISSCVIRNPNAVVIGPEGELYKCWNDVGDPERVYGYLDGRITNEKLLYQYLIGADHLNNKECSECKFMPVCSGGCPYERIVNEKKGGPQPCALIKENPDDFLWLHYQHKKKEGSFVK